MLFFTAAGSYVLTCTADDGQASTSTDVTVTVADDGTAQAFCNATCSDLPEWIDAARAYALTATLDKSSGDWQFSVLHFVPYAN